MFSKKHRIKASEINQIFSEKIKSEHSDAFFVRKKENDLEQDRFAVLVPKKVYKLAVKRHKYKRLVTSLLKELIADLKLNTSSKTKKDYVITLKKDISNYEAVEIKKQLANFLG
jgi:ribonuclease P protein component